jgi:hypothetical protein
MPSSSLDHSKGIFPCRGDKLALLIRQELTVVYPQISAADLNNFICTAHLMSISRSTYPPVFTSRCQVRHDATPLRVVCLKLRMLSTPHTSLRISGRNIVDSIRCLTIMVLSIPVGHTVVPDHGAPLGGGSATAICLGEFYDEYVLY